MKPNLLPGVFLACAILLSAGSVRAAEDYVGAAAVLQKVATASGPEAKSKNESSAPARLKRDIEAFKGQVATLKPEAAAQSWLALLDRQWKLTPAELQEGYQRNPGTNNFNPQDLWHALPPPPAWDALRQAIEARPAAKGKSSARELALRLFVHTLAADRAAQTKDVADMETLFAKSSVEESYELANVLDRMGEIMMENSADSEAVMKTLERRLARMTGQGYEQMLLVPNLVAMVGPDKAEAFLRRALVRINGELFVEQGEETQKLARKLALELMDKLKTPQWRLACTLDAGPLYEAMEKKFAKTEDADTNAPPEIDVPVVDHAQQLNRDRGPQQEAQTYYFLGLIAGGRTKEAVVMAKKLGRGDEGNLPAEALKSLERAGHTRALHDFLRELLAQNPDLPFWDEYIQLAAKVGETEKMLELARAAAARDDLSNKRRNLIRQNLYRALLAADQVDEGIKEIRQTLANKEIKLQSRYGGEGSGRGQLAINLAELGQLLHRPELIEEGIGFARAATAEKSAPQEEYIASALRIRLARLLAELGRGPEAEALLIESLTTAAQRKPQRNYGYNSETASPALTALAGLYHRAGRSADVLLLLDQSPDWGVKDLKDLGGHSFGGWMGMNEDSGDISITQLAADALVAAGRKADARKILEAALVEDAGSDPTYELLIKIGGEDLPARLDAVFARDQFEERPLIWKAHLLKQAGKLEEAEAAARRAISIDPSDGEQGPGRRMRAYAVLADIREARGDQKQADFFRGAVAAIRLSEKADRYYGAGLLKQAVKMYEDSLTRFADAYCIQSRLALRLAELGLHDLAEEHYRRAFELMPDSFGRVESHCFGCERAFDGERAQGIAEKIFIGFTKNTPAKPQVHYLLGYLREEQGRYPEALTCYREAVRLDPDYLNAWKHIESVGERHHLPVADMDAVALNLLRLDPLGRHAGGNEFRKVTNLRALWNAIEAAAKLQPKPLESLFPLTASKAKLEKAESEKKEGDEFGFSERYGSYYSRYSRTGQQLVPAAAVMENNFIATVQSLLVNSSGRFTDE